MPGALDRHRPQWLRTPAAACFFGLRWLLAGCSPSSLASESVACKYSLVLKENWIGSFAIKIKDRFKQKLRHRCYSWTFKTKFMSFMLVLHLTMKQLDYGEEDSSYMD
ncbi:uncharacterized protein LOC135690235 [Rhopilema esculentum]|uniref:uncharacterized protein LOC135690235 n=1 Tax=Rhopilema esculentum TaxID=499914 RepID=UPI0031E128C9